MRSSFCEKLTVFCSFLVLGTLLISSAVFAEETKVSEVSGVSEIPEGFVSLFDGKTMTGWSGNPTFWTVEDGCLTGTSTNETPVPYSQFLILQEKTVSDFELQADFRILSGNSGIEFRAVSDFSREWGLNGYQADIAPGEIMGLIYGEGWGGILAWRGQKIRIGADRKPIVVEQFASMEELAKSIHRNDWNTYRVTAVGNTITLYINGVKMSELVEEDPDAPTSGTFGFQVHPGPAMKVQFKNIYLKSL